MKVCILGSGLTALTLAKALVKKEILVDIFYKNKKNYINKTRTLGISKSNVDYFNKNILNVIDGMGTIDEVSFIISKLINKDFKVD